MSAGREPVGYQRETYNELLASARDFYQGDWHKLPVRVRILPLIVGSSGVGKSYLVRQLAKELGLPLFVASAGDWILLGTSNRGAPPTIPLLYSFVDRNERGIIFLDEIEKLGGEDSASDWRRFIQLEVFSVLDRIITSGVLENEEGPRFRLDAEKLQERFQREFFIAGAGAWQSLWRPNDEAIGFRETRETVRYPTHAELAATLRLEILNRFSSKVLMLPPLSADDYRAAFAEIVARVPQEVRAALPDLEIDMIEDAVRTRKGFRFFEEILAVAVRRMRLSSSETKSAMLVPTTPDRDSRAADRVSEPTMT